MEPQSWDALCIVSYYAVGAPEYCAKINFVPSDGIFNLGKCEMNWTVRINLTGKRMDLVERCGRGENTDVGERAHKQPMRTEGQRRRTNEQERWGSGVWVFRGWQPGPFVLSILNLYCDIVQQPFAQVAQVKIPATQFIERWIHEQSYLEHLLQNEIHGF